MANDNAATETIIFDLSEVLIAGLVGIEKELAPKFGLTPEDTLRCFGGEALQALCCGHSSEEAFLQAAAKLHKSAITTDELKAIIRQNFHQRIDGMESVLEQLESHYRLVLLSDHAREWVAYIRRVHPWLSRFDAHYFSFDLGRTKRDPATFSHLLSELDSPAEHCLFIDDNLGNVKNAESVGIPSIRFESAAQLRSELVQLGLLEPSLHFA